MRERVFPTIAGAATLVLGLGVRALFTGWFAKYAGVALWATLVYLLIVWVRPSIRVRTAFAMCVAISFVVEFLQLTPGPRWLSERVHPMSALVLGTTFNAPDLPAYVVGGLLGVGLHLSSGQRSEM